MAGFINDRGDYIDAGVRDYSPSGESRDGGKSYVEFDTPCPQCACRVTKHIGDSALTLKCPKCGHIFYV